MRNSTYTIRAVALLIFCCLPVLVSAQTYTLTVNAGANGTTSPSGKVQVQAGAPQSITAYPDSGYSFYNWTTTHLTGSVRIAGQTASTTITIDGNATIQANFIPRGAVYDIDSVNRQYNYATSNFHPTAITRVPGVAFRFTAPAAGAYTFVVEFPDTTKTYFMDYGTDSLFSDYVSYIDGARIIKQAFMASAAGTVHYFSVLVSATTSANYTFSIRYEPAAALSIEHSGFGTTLPSGRIALRTDTSITVSAKSTSTVSYFGHWEVVSGTAVIKNSDKIETGVTAKSGESVIRAVFLMYPSDTIIVENDGNGSTFPVDTVFVRTGNDTTLSAIPNGGYLFNSWTTVKGSITFGNASTARTTVNVSGGKATVRANFTVDPNAEPTIAISGIDISGHPDICVTASVTDTSGNGISGLDTSFFTLREDGTARPFHLTTVTEAGGTSVCLVIDKSSSMGTAKMSDAIVAAQTYIASMNRYDRCAIVAFNGTVKLVHEMSGNKATLHEAVGNIVASGSTAILDGADLGISQLLEETNPRSVIIFSDGSGDGSISIDSVVNHALHNNVTIYSVGIGGAKTVPLKDIADATGGFYTYSPDAAQLSEVYSTIKRSVESRYILCYQTTDQVFNGDTHSVVISVRMNGKTSLDTTTWDETNRPPVITLTTETEAMLSGTRPENKALNITAKVTDDGSVKNVRLFYRTTGSDTSYTEVAMTLLSGSTYGTVLPADSVVSPGIDFYILATDNKNLIGKSPNVLSPESNPWVIRIGGDGLQITVISDTTVDEGTALLIHATAADLSGIPPSISADRLPSRATFSDSGNGAGLFAWETGCNDHGIYHVSFTAVNSTDSVTAHVAITVRDVNFPPAFIPLRDTAITRYQGGVIAVQTTDCDGDSAVLDAPSIPTGSVFHDNGNGTGALEWAPGLVDSGQYTTVFTAFDGGTLISDTVIITITDTVPVVIPTSARLTGGHYVDENGDGIVDAVYLQFDKEIPVDSMAVSLTWPGVDEQQTGPLSEAALNYGPDHATVRVAFPAATQQANGIRTDGLMSAEVLFTAFPGGQQTARVTDSAAPVIDRVQYRPAKPATGNGTASDTLHVWFSENVRLGTTAAPFSFINDSAAVYSPALRFHSLQGNHAVFIVTETEGPSALHNGDSIFINPISAVGDSGTWQNNPDNRRVLLKWNPGSLITLVPLRSTGSDPMNISGTGAQLGIRENHGKLVVISTKQPFDTLIRNGQPVTDSRDGAPAFGTAMIYDAVGNLVKTDALVKKSAVDKLYYVLWDGTNRFNRRVASGTYLVKGKVTIDNTLFEPKSKFILRWR